MITITRVSAIDADGQKITSTVKASFKNKKQLESYRKAYKNLGYSKIRLIYEEEEVTA